MKKMAILYSADFKYISMGGVTEYVEKIIIQNKDYEIDVYGVSNPGDFELGKRYIREVGGVKYNFIALTDKVQYPISWHYFIAMIKQIKLFNKYDIIYAQRVEYVLPFIFSPIKKKTLFAIHGSGLYGKEKNGSKFNNLINLKIEKVGIRISKMTIVLLNREEYGVPYYRKSNPRYADKIQYSKVPIDTKNFKKYEKKQARQELGIELEKTVIVYFGRIQDHPKRVFLFPEIIQKIKKQGKDICLYMIGDGESLEIMKKKVESLKLEDNIIFLGRLQHGETLSKYICAADATMVLSVFEGICMSALESIACGIPVIATDVGDIHDYIKNGNNGWIIKNESNQQIVEDTVNIICKIAEGEKVKMNDDYMNYDSERVVKELFQLIEEKIN